MRTLSVAVAFMFMSATAYAQTPTCKAQAAHKTLAGAAMTSFMKKCESDAKKSCEVLETALKITGDYAK